MIEFDSATLKDGTPIRDLRTKCSDKEYPFLVEALHDTGSVSIIKVNEKGEASVGHEYDLFMPETTYKVILALYKHRKDFRDKEAYFRIFSLERLEEVKNMENLLYMEIIEIKEEQLIY